MIQAGIFNLLTAKRIAPPGMYLVDEEDNEVLLPNTYVPEDMLIDDEINVFIFYDSEDRLTATTRKPKIELHQFAALQVVAITPVGAFMDWGLLGKDLLVPFSEQSGRLQRGEWYLTYLLFDEKTERLVGTNRVHKYLEKEDIQLEEGQEVDLLIGGMSDLGIKVIVNNKYEGLIYKNQVFKNIQPNDRVKGFVKTIREDNKLDIILEKQGHKSIEPNAQKILEKLKVENGFLPLHDKSSPDLIKRHLEMSKKAFKKAVGNLYRQKIIDIEDQGITLK